MSSSNYRRNKAAIDQFRKELKDMCSDISDIDTKVLNRAVNEGVKYAKNHSPVITGFYRKSWKASPILKRNGGVTKMLENSADYASYVNYGHRTVNKAGETTGYVKSKLGDHLLEKTVNHVSKRMVSEFEKAVKEVQAKHDK